MANYNANHKAILDQIILGHPGVTPGKMFGYPAYYAAGKLCICLYEQGVGIKLPEATVKKLLASDANAVPFQPMGKPKMREWVQINLADSDSYQTYKKVFEASIRFLLSKQETR